MCTQIRHAVPIASEVHWLYPINVIHITNTIKEYAEKFIFDKIKITLKNIGIIFDSFFNESTLYDNGDIDRIIKKLKEKKLIYQKDGATWLKAKNLGRDSDRVIIKSSGEPTYRLPDIAYHRDKFLIN